MPVPDELTRHQQTQWSSAAAGWERWDDWFEKASQNLSEWLCDAARVGPGKHVLDVACGSGQPAAMVAERVLPGGRVTAIDLSSEMVEVTQRKMDRLDLHNVDVRQMDAQALVFADNTFDAATCRFGLMFCPDPVRAAAEVRRVLRPGARFALAVWDEPAKNPFFTSLSAVLAQFVPAPPPDPNAPGVFRLAPPGELAHVLKEAGFSHVTVEARPMVWRYEPPEQYWQIQSEIAAPLRAAIASLDAAAVAQLKAAVLDALAPYVRDGGVDLAAVPLCASAVK
jgi:ubiquinone/menaquinone biosynthesis C-methylase UbiE